MLISFPGKAMIRFQIERQIGAKDYPVERDVYAKVTGYRYPYTQKNEHGGKSYFAYCPSCLNPIQIIGIMKKQQNGPYGRHTGKPIKDVGDWNYKRYQFCPYAAKKNRISPGNYDRDGLIIDDDTISLYNALRDNFPRAIYVISKTLGIFCSNTFWLEALNVYLVNDFYTYPWLTFSNMPYIFMYLGLGMANLYGISVENDGELYNALKDHPNVRLTRINEKYSRVGNKDGFLRLQFRFLLHKQEAETGKPLKETVEMYVDELQPYSNFVARSIFHKIILFDQTFFRNLVNKGGYQDAELLRQAKEKMVDIQKTV